MSSRSAAAPAVSVRSTSSRRSTPQSPRVPIHAGRTPPTTETTLPPIAATPFQPSRPVQSQSHRRAPSAYTSYEASATTYPNFLPFFETARLQAGFFVKGLVDANRWDRVVRIVIEYVEMHLSLSEHLNI